MKTLNQGNIILDESARKELTQLQNKCKQLEPTLKKKIITVTSDDGSLVVVLDASPKIHSIECQDTLSIPELIHLLNKGLDKYKEILIETSNKAVARRSRR